MADATRHLIRVRLIWRKTIAFFKQPGAIRALNGLLAWNLARHPASISLLVSPYVASGTPGVFWIRFSLR